MSEVTDRGVIGMPFEVAMSSELSRRQFYSRAQSFLAERDQASATIAELRAEVERLNTQAGETIEALVVQRDQLRAEIAALQDKNENLQARLNVLGWSEALGMPVAKEQGWIACAERLPDADNPVWLTGPTCAGIGARCDLGDGTWVWGFASSGIYWEDGAGWIIDEYDTDEYDVTHWHPLHEPHPRQADE